MSRSNEQNEKIATAVGQFMRVAMSNPGPGGKEKDGLLAVDGAAKLEKLLLVFCAAVQDEANARVERASEDLRDRFAQAALAGLVSDTPQAVGASDYAEFLASRAFLVFDIADAMLARRKKTA